ncbi:phosphotriesterase-related protein [Allosaccharopolyspora coralli]|uniref:Phosphotriesterase-related protein n=1 Tax=Allosaccharopolyspora coralli TaxID=2665642 RepID=A0A5Q3Q3H4_9PSEU|nr:phosphotriesterase [Allosaccharopolyspora coralli]QGK69002.1 phosphotriesterase-related protein [Allosaccharopolyspora coralli]
MTAVHTVNGPVSSAELGRVLVHEHVFVLGEEYRQNYTDWDEDARVEDAVRRLTELKELGIDTILDPTVLGLGRYLPRIQKIAARTPLNIVPATGIYTYNDVPFQFHHHGPGLLFDKPEPMVDLFVRDLTEGIADTGVRAAFLKCAIEDPGLTPGVERVMRAVGRASVLTGAPITVHTNAHTHSGLVAQRVLAEEGVDLSRVVIGHSGDSTDLDYLTKLAEAGSLLGMDRFGLDVLLPFDDRIDTIVELVRRGFAENVTVAHDAACFIDWFDEAEKEAAAPKWNYRHISEDVLPALLERGLTDDDLDTILVHNPRRYFERE